MKVPTIIKRKRVSSSNSDDQSGLGFKSETRQGSVQLANDPGLQEESAISSIEQFSKSPIWSPERRSTAVAARAREAAVEGGRGGRWLGGSFLIFVLLPAIFVLLYDCFVASRAYVVETKLTVTAASSNDDISSSASSLIGKLGITKSVGTTQDSLILLDYIKSRSVINDLGGRAFMEKIYDDKKIDWWSRLDADRNYETLWYYWRDHVTVSVDTISNIMTVRTIAFTPQDAVKLSEEVIKKSEALLNQLSLRNRTDVLNRAQGEVERSASELAKTRTDIISFQQKAHSVSPIETAKRITTIIASLTAQRIEVETQLATSGAVGVKAGPGLKPMEQQLAVIDDQIKKLDQLLTDGNGPNPVSEQLREFELLTLKTDFEEKIYTISRAAYEQARRDIDRQQLYISVIVPPLLPDYATYPRIFTDTGLVFVAALIFWAIGSLLVASVADSLG